MLARLRSYARTLGRRDAFEDAMDDEMRFHLESRAADLVRRGLSPAEAARRARMEFGSIEKQKDIARASVGLRLFDQCRGDVRYALRTFGRNRGFAAAAIVTLALGIGANTAIFDLTDALMLRWLPVRDPQHLLKISLASQNARQSTDTISYPLATALDDQHDVFEGVAGFSSAHTFTVGSNGSMTRVSGALVTGAFYDTLGVTPALGRLLSRRDDAPHAALVVVLSDGYWERAFARDPAIVGRTIVLNGARAEIIGVSPRGFDGANVGATADVTVAIAALPRVDPQAAGLLGPGNSWLRALARPQRGMSMTEAAARLTAEWPQIAARAINPAWPLSRKRGLTSARPVLAAGGTGWSYLRGVYLKPLQILMGVVALVLVIACANVASLMLARASARRREIAVRLAIGAGRGRIVRQLLVESMTLALIGAAAGILVATTAGRLILSVISTPHSPIVFDLTPNWHVLAFTATVAIVTAVLFGIAPALQSTAAGPAQVLKDDARTATSRSRLLPALVAAQIALSLVLLIGAGLFVRTLRNLHAFDAGFRSEGVLIASLERRPGTVPVSVLESARQIPGVVSASVSTHTPLSGSLWSEPAVPAGQQLPEHDTALFVGASPGFFATLQIPLVAGRDFTEADTRQSRSVAIVNEAYSRTFFPSRSPMGAVLSAIVRGERRDLEIVGVARNTSATGLRNAPPPTIYVPYSQLAGDVPSNIEVKVAGPIAPVATALEQLLQPLLPNEPVEMTRLSTQVDGTLVQERMMALLGTGFGLLALLLAAVGTYGLLAYGVARRTREIGIRMALGARRRGVVSLVLAAALAPLFVGVVLGIPAALWLSRWIESMLFGLKSSDPMAIGTATLLLVIVAHLAAWVPALRASRVDPLVALRHE